MTEEFSFQPIGLDERESVKEKKVCKHFSDVFLIISFPFSCEIGVDAFWRKYYNYNWTLACIYAAQEKNLMQLRHQAL